MTQASEQVSKRNTKTSLASLNRRFLGSAYVAVLGVWCILAPRLELLAFLKNDPQLNYLWFYTDLVGLTLNIFGIFSVYYYYQRLNGRFKRLEALGEHLW